MANIYESIAEIMKKGYSVSKDSMNSSQGFKYRSIDAVMNTFQPLMAEAGIFVVPEVLDQSREERVNSSKKTIISTILKVKYTFYASDGTSVSATVIGEGMDFGDKSANKAMAIAMKYAMFQVFCIPTEDMVDPDKECFEVEAKAEPKEEPKKDTNEEIYKCACCGKDIHKGKNEGKVYQKKLYCNSCYDKVNEIKD